VLVEDRDTLEAVVKAPPARIGGASGGGIESYR